MPKLKFLDIEISGPSKLVIIIFILGYLIFYSEHSPNIRTILVLGMAFLGIIIIERQRKIFGDVV